MAKHPVRRHALIPRRVRRAHRQIRRHARTYPVQLRPVTEEDVQVVGCSVDVAPVETRIVVETFRRVRSANELVEFPETHRAPREQRHERDRLTLSLPRVVYDRKIDAEDRFY